MTSNRMEKRNESLPVPESLTEKRQSSNGNGCFFSESAFLRVMGPGPSLEERLHMIATRPRHEEIKTKIKIDVDRSIFKSSAITLKNKSNIKLMKVKEGEFGPETCDAQEASVKYKDVIIDSSDCHLKKLRNNKTRSQTVLEAHDSVNKETSGSEQVLSQNADCNNIEGVKNNQKDNQISEGPLKPSHNDDHSVKNNQEDNQISEGPLKPSHNDDHSDGVESDSLNQGCHFEGESSSASGSIEMLDNSKLFTVTDSTNEMKVADSEKNAIEDASTDSASNTMSTDVTANPGTDDEGDVCCLVMPNSSDDESEDEDVGLLNTAGKVTNNVLLAEINNPSEQSVPKKTSIEKQGSEEPLCLVMPSVSSDEQSGLEDAADFYRRNALGSNQNVGNSVKASSTTPPKEFKVPKASHATELSSVTNVVSKESIQSPERGMTLGDKMDRVETTSSQNKPVQNLNTEKSCDGNFSQNDVKGTVQIMSKNDRVPSPAGSSMQKGGNKPEEKVFKNLRSKLSKKQHKRYIQLYKKLVCPMMKGNRKAVYSDAEMRELVELEELQQHVSQEQVEYQDYLKHKALRNHNAYNFLAPDASNYSHSRYSGYRRPRNYIKNYAMEDGPAIPLVLEDKNASTLMTFQKTLLKLGNSPRITLPDVKDGMNPVQIKVELASINNLFPSYIRNKNIGIKFSDHKMMSEDSNAVKLAEEEEVDFVMSSSSFKCLLNNHASNVMRAWDIPVTIRHSPYGHKCVYFDKPLLRDDFPIREFNALFYKYALRTSVSRARGQGGSRIQANTTYGGKGHQTKMATSLREKRFSADDLDMFTTDTVNDIETFGSFSTTSGMTTRFSSSKSLHSPLPSETEKGNREDIVNPGPDSLEGNTPQTPQSPVRRSTRQSKRLSESHQSIAGSNLPISPDLKSETGPPVKIAKTDRDACMESSAESVPDELKRKPRSSVITSKSSTLESAMETESPASPPNELQSPESPTESSPANLNGGDFVTTIPVEVPLSPPGHHRPPPSLLDSIIGPPSGTRSHTATWQQNMDKLPDADNPDGFLPLNEKCNHVIYNLWKLGSRKGLIRCNYHGAIKDKDKARYVYLSPKMEYQSDAGMEQVTLSEMTRTWASCFIRPGTSLVRARINAFTSEMLMVEEKTIEGILNPSLPFRPDHSLAVVEQLLDQVQSFPEGQYLLSHLKGNKYCKVRKWHGKANILPAPKKKRTGRAKAGQVPWIPIDPTILTPSHIHNARIPATFMPSDWTMTVNKNPQGEGHQQHTQGQKGGWKKHHNNKHKKNWNKNKQNN